MYFESVILASCLLGVITSYVDWQHGLIKNLHLLFFMGLGLAINFLFLDFYIIPSYLMNAFLALLVGYFLWLAGFWSAGDAKLFFVFSLILSPVFYHYEQPIPFFHSFSILVNTFALAFFYYLLKAFTIPKINDLRDVFISSIDRYRFAVFFFGFFVASWFVSIFFSLIGIAQNMLTSLIGIYFFFELISQLRLEKKAKHLFESLPGRKISGQAPMLLVLVFLSLFRILLDFGSLFSLSYWINFIQLFAVFYIFVFFLLAFVSRSIIREIKIASLKPKDVLAENIFLDEKGNLKRSPAVFSGITQALRPVKNLLFGPQNGKLSGEEVEKIRALFSENQKDSVLVQEPVSFAHFLFLGVLLTILFRTDFFYFAINLIMGTL